MEHILRIERGDPEESRDLELATRITEVLCKTYPGYPWRVSFTGHALIVRNDVISICLTDRAMKEGRFGLIAQALTRAKPFWLYINCFAKNAPGPFGRVGTA